MVRKLILVMTILAAGAYIGWVYSPWPSALFYRLIMDRGGWAAHDALARHVPSGIGERRGLVYDASNPVAKFDVFRPPGYAGEKLPAIFWIHGGGFLSGSKDLVANYLRILAAKGFVTIGIDYSLAPRAQYPAAVREAVAALAHVHASADALGLDRTRLLLAGDSAGAQIAAQLALIVSLPGYAAEMGIAGPMPRADLKGVILYCGVYDPEGLHQDGPAGGFVRAVLWSYFGVKDLADDPRVQQFSIVRNIAPGLPPLFVSAGNADPLKPNSYKLAEVAKAAGVEVETLFFPLDYQPPLAHEYQFDLDSEAGRQALERSAAFAAARTR